MGPLHHTKQRRPTHINLLYFEKKEKTHFCWIKNLSRLVSKQLSFSTRRKHICDGCLQYYAKEHLLREHQQDECGKVKIILPHGGKLFLKFLQLCDIFFYLFSFPLRQNNNEIRWP